MTSEKLFVEHNQKIIFELSKHQEKLQLEANKYNQMTYTLTDSYIKQVI